MHLAANEGFVNLVEILLKSNAKLDPVANNGRTPLHVSCVRGKLEIVKLLIENGAQIDL